MSGGTKADFTSGNDLLGLKQTFPATFQLMPIYKYMP
jgi:hypothetical protein